MPTDSIYGTGILSPESSIETSRQEGDITALTDMNLSISQGIMENQGLLLNGDFDFDTLGFPELSNFDQDTSLDWMFRSVDDDSFSMPFAASASGNHPSEENMAPFQVPPRQHNARPISDDRAPQSDCDEAISQLELPSYRPRNRCDPDDPWPMEWYAVDMQRSELPMLGRPEEPDPNAGSYFGMDPISSSTREKMKDTARLAFERTLWPSINLDNFPSRSKLDHCIDLYFAHFHPVSFRFWSRRQVGKLIITKTFPIIHRPTYETAKDNVVVTLAIACIGACYTEFDGARSFSNAFSELNRRILLFMVWPVNAYKESLLN
jgi:hypothetical protein